MVASILVPLAAAALPFVMRFLTEDKSRPATQTRTVEPPMRSVPLLDRASRETLNLYNTGIGRGVYSGPRVAPLSQQTLSAINAIGDISSAYGNPYLRNLAFGPSVSERNLSSMAAGDLLGQNSYFNAALQSALRNVGQDINRMMSGAGRYGSGAHSGALGRALGDVSATSLARQYNTDIGNMIAANQLIDQTRAGQLQGGLGLLGGQQRAAMNRLAASSLIDAYQQNLLDAQRQQFTEQQLAPWQNLNRFTGITSSLTTPYLSAVSTMDPGYHPGENFMTDLSTGMKLTQNVNDLWDQIREMREKRDKRNQTLLGGKK